MRVFFIVIAVVVSDIAPDSPPAWKRKIVPAPRVLPGETGWAAQFIRMVVANIVDRMIPDRSALDKRGGPRRGYAVNNTPSDDNNATHAYTDPYATDEDLWSESDSDANDENNAGVYTRTRSRIRCAHRRRTHVKPREMASATRYRVYDSDSSD